MANRITLAHVHVLGPEHNVHLSISMPTHTLFVFKYDEEKGLCEYDYFSDQGETSDWIQKKIKPNPRPFSNY